MFPTWRIQLKEAKIAYEGGRLNEASRLLEQNGLCGYSPGRKLSLDIARSMAQRAKQRIEAGESGAPWRDLQEAERLGLTEGTARSAREELLERGLAEIDRLMTICEPRQAIDRIERVERRHSSNMATRLRRQIAEHIRSALASERSGRFVEANRHWTTAVEVGKELKATPLMTFLEERFRQGKLNGAEHHKLTESLHQCLTRCDPIREPARESTNEPADQSAWTEVLSLSDALLAIAPHDAAARDARRRAWRAVGLGSSLHLRKERRQRDKDKQHSAQAQSRADQAIVLPKNSTSPGSRSAHGDTVTEPTQNTRFLMWVDAVGGYLVILGDHITIGQPSSDGAIDIPILADISRRHCVILRDGSGYLLDPLRAAGDRGIRINNHPVSGPTALTDGATVDLGQGVQLTFRKPHALSATARLDLTSHHKTNPTVDSILLMADTCVLGPKSTSHITCRKWEQDVLLYQQDNTLYCRTQGQLEIDGETCQQQGAVQLDSHIEGENFAIHLETLP